MTRCHAALNVSKSDPLRVVAGAVDDLHELLADDWDLEARAARSDSDPELPLMPDTRPAKVAQVAFELRGMRFVSGPGPDDYPALFDAAFVLRGPFFRNAGPNKRPDEAAGRGTGTGAGQCGGNGTGHHDP